MIKKMTDRSGWFIRLTVGLVLFGLAAAAVWVVRDNLNKCFRVPVQLVYVEGFIAADAALLAQGHALYRDISKQPYMAFNFTPLSILATAGLIKLGLPPMIA